MSKSKKRNYAMAEKVWSKNTNEYRLDGKIYILDVKKSSCKEIVGERYILNCKIKQRGEHEYFFIKNNDFITKQYSDKRLYLTPKAKKKIEKTVEEIDAILDEMHRPGYRLVYIPDIGMKFWYRGVSRGVYTFIVSICCNMVAEYTRIYESVSVRDILHALYYDTYCYYRNKGCEGEFESKRKRISYLFESNINTIEENPLYRSALENSDVVLQKLIKAYYRIIDKSECSLLGKFMGIRILPTLSEEFDKDYYVDSDTVNCRMLNQSGYRILHRPYFSMKNYTHSAWSLNPYRKSGIDAAPESTATISFDDYLELFDYVNGGSSYLYENKS